MLLLFFTLFHLDGVFGAETVETMAVMEGDSVTLYTNLTEIQNDDTILWMFGPKDSIISHITRKHDLTSVFFSDDERFRGRLQVDQKTGSLTIRNTRIRHLGKYKLTISRQKTTIKIFEVAVVGVVGETDGVKSLSVTEGESVILHIDVSEIQRDDLIVWRFGDKGVLLATVDVEANGTSLNDADERFKDRLALDHTGSLSIKKTRTTDSGLYEVQIRGRESSQRFLVSVSAVPHSGPSPGLTAVIVVAVLLLAAVVSSVVLYYRRKISELKKEREKKVSVSDGDEALLGIETDLQAGDEVRWWYHDEHDLIAEYSGGNTTIHDGFDERFRSKLTLDNKTGSLTISNTMTVHSGLYILQISNRSTTKRIKKKFILTVRMKTVPVKEGETVPLEIDGTIQKDDEILWTFGPENVLVVRNHSGTTNIGQKFTDRVKLDTSNGSLTVNNITAADSGHFKLQIINSEHTMFRRFCVTVTGFTGERPNDSSAFEIK
ncbi:uncharacterized protein LOC122327357 [Puntigrus tetrazona]|uniref:uncharacterized protein LOC122327357 n=1 Tax=Puntigrus tetrazona TaxID=1606681 RepID=UPI001C8A4991|nr:uncharacterized protein LOC122327357 [Puntigrus tetrazona]